MMKFGINMKTYYISRRHRVAKSIPIPIIEHHSINTISSLLDFERTDRYTIDANILETWVRSVFGVTLSK
jgi:hypothetical protein